MRLVTYGDDPSQIKYLKSDYMNIGEGDAYIDTFSKFEAFQKMFAKSDIDMNEIVIFVDGYDVIQRRTDMDVFINKFKEFNSDIVISTETHCWPSPWMRSLFPPSPTKYRFPNAGTYVGYAWAIKKLIQWDEYRQAYDDQGYLHDFYLKTKNVRIGLDVHQILFQTGTFVPWKEIEASQAWFVHFNGKSHLTIENESILERFSRGEPIGSERQLHLSAS